MALDSFFSDLVTRALRGDLRLSDAPAFLFSSSLGALILLLLLRRNREAPVRCEHHGCGGEFPQRVMRRVALNGSTIQWWCPLHKIP